MSNWRMVDAAVKHARSIEDGRVILLITLVGGNVLFGDVNDDDTGIDDGKNYLLTHNEHGHVEFIGIHAIAAIMVKVVKPTAPAHS